MGYKPGTGIVARAMGPLPGWQQDVPAAESFALLVALRHAGPVVVFYTDCQYVQDTFRAGPSLGSSGWFRYAGIWREIWRLIGDIGEANVQVHWMPAHTSAAAVYEGRVTAVQRFCNAEADVLAKRGAGRHPHEEAIAERTVNATVLAKKVGRYLGEANARLGNVLPRDTSAATGSGVGEAGPRLCGEIPACIAAKRAKKHVVVVSGTRVRCRVCLKSAASQLALENLQCRRVRGDAAHAHVLREIGGIVYCVLCGRYTEKRVRGLRDTCDRRTGTAKHRNSERLTALRRLERGRHPRTNRSLGGTAAGHWLLADSATAIASSPGSSRRRLVGKQPPPSRAMVAPAESAEGLCKWPQLACACSVCLLLTVAPEVIRPPASEEGATARRRRRGRQPLGGF